MSVGTTEACSTTESFSCARPKGEGSYFFLLCIGSTHPPHTHIFHGIKLRLFVCICSDYQWDDVQCPCSVPCKRVTYRPNLSSAPLDRHTIENYVVKSGTDKAKLKALSMILFDKNNFPNGEWVVTACGYDKNSNTQSLANIQRTETDIRLLYFTGEV